MRMTVALPLLLSLCFASGVMAADTTTKAPSEAQTAQREKMTTCNKEAADKSLKGDERKAFMSNCLKAKPAAEEGKKMTPQQQKMGACNTEAAGKGLKGEERKTFMSSCLKKAA
ncbi:PsiF family protein [Budvicia diplopodorum]|uniref:PsiF family protein n=1 Tax=Budvicia diplopodorum TaxID=1119056 RepID=UPI001358A7AF|nr:PsiF family protein [Budvicia diplopodorum]